KGASTWFVSAVRSATTVRSRPTASRYGSSSSGRGTHRSRRRRTASISLGGADAAHATRGPNQDDPSGGDGVAGDGSVGAGGVLTGGSWNPNSSRSAGSVDSEYATGSPAKSGWSTRARRRRPSAEISSP